MIKLAIALLFATGCQLAYTGGAKPVAPIALDATWVHAAATPVVVQAKETDCGLAALAMVAGAWGKRWSVSELAQAMPPGDKGVKLSVLRDYARAHGLEAYALAATPHDLQRELTAGRPVVLGLMLPYDMQRNQAHYEVAIAMHVADGTVITIDPATGHWMKRPSKVLEAEWNAASHAALVVTAEATP